MDTRCEKVTEDGIPNFSYRVPAQYARLQPSEEVIFAALGSEDPVSAIEDLLDNEGLDPNLPIGYGMTMLVSAILKRHVELVITLIERGADADFKSSSASTVRFACGVEKDEEKENSRRLIMCQLLNSGANADDHDGLWLAAKWLDLTAAKLMIEQGNAKKSLSRFENEVSAKQEDVDFGLGTPLHEVAAADIRQFQDKKTQRDMIDLFLKNGADLKAKDAKGRTAMEVALEAENPEAAEYLRVMQNVWHPAV